MNPEHWNPKAWGLAAVLIALALPAVCALALRILLIVGAIVRPDKET